MFFLVSYLFYLEVIVWKFLYVDTVTEMFTIMLHTYYLEVTSSEKWKTVALPTGTHAFIPA